MGWLRYSVVCAVAVFATGLAWLGWRTPPLDGLERAQQPLDTRILDRHGHVLATLSRHERAWVGLKDIPPALQDAIVAIEDRRFYRHGGVDPLGVLRAGFANVWGGGRLREGGSTLTMQLARRLYLDDQPTLSRKLREAWLATRIEKIASKSRILELYLNSIYFGRGTYGVMRASQHYFNKPVSRLTLAECALLAALPQAPEYLSEPGRESRLRERQLNVLQSMHEMGMISETELRRASQQHAKGRLLGRHALPRAENKAPYFTSFVLQHLPEVEAGGLTIRTTVDCVLQRKAERALAERIRRDGPAYNASEGAVVAIDNRSGEIRALVGGTGWSRENQFNRAWQAQRQAGSTFKAVVYAAALEEGWRPEDRVADRPVSWNGWKPSNEDGRFLGSIPLWKALMLSRNVAAARLAADVGPEKVLRLAQQLGLAGEQTEANLSLALGAIEVSPLQMASAYSAIANGGIRMAPYAVESITDASGKTVRGHRRHPVRVMSGSTANGIARMLENVVERGTGTRARLPGVRVAGKTGTTDRARDAWFVGWTPELTAAVWIGNDDQTPTWNCYGGTLPAAVWTETMR